MTVFALVEALKVVTDMTVPAANELFRVEPLAWVHPPVPESRPVMVTVPLFVTVPGLVTVMIGIEMVPLNAALAVSNKTVPEPVIANVPLLTVMPARMTTLILVPLTVPPLTVIKPIKVLANESFVSESVPLETVVVVLTVKATPPVVKVPPETVRAPESVNADASVH